MKRIKEHIRSIMRDFRNKWFIQLVIIICTVFALQSLSAEVIDVNSCNPNCIIGKSLEILEDKTNLLTIDNILKENHDWKKSESDKPNFGFSSSAYWVKFKVENKKETAVNYFLELDYALFDYAHFYDINSSGIHEIILGDMVPFSARKIINRNPIFEINLSANESKIIYMKFSSQGSLIFPLYIWDRKAFSNSDHNIQFFYGIYFGIFLIMVFYNLFLYISVKDIVYLYYVIYLIGISFFVSILSGFAYEYILPEYPILINKSIFIIMTVFALGLIQFTRSFLNLKITLQKADLMLKIIFFIMLILTSLTHFLPYRIMMPIYPPFFILSSTICYISAIILFKKGYRLARFYLLSWTIFLVLGSIGALRVLGFSFINDFLGYRGFEIGSALEAALLSLALADRINILKKENEDSQQALIASQKESIEEQKKLITSYARFVPEQLLSFLGKDIITKVGLGDSIQKDMTILFSDIRSFTSISETLSPSENFGFINSYLETMGPIIRKHNGFIDKYIGDAIMALFPNRTSDAIDASIEMFEELHKLNVKRKSKGYAPISIGIGIHTGIQMLGIIGEKERMEGTVISDVVNTASRLEGLTKTYSTALLVSEDVLDKVEGKSKYQYRYLDTVKVKGKNKAVRILEILNGVSSRIRDLKLNSKTDFEEAIEFYKNKNFDSCINIMKSILEKDPKDKAAELYLERSNFYLKNGTDPNWDGIEKLDFK